MNNMAGNEAQNQSLETELAPFTPGSAEAYVPMSYDTPVVTQAAQLKYAVEMREISKCPAEPNYTTLGMAYRFAFADVNDQRNFLPIAKLQPERTVSGRKPVGECCEGWSLSMFTTLDKLQARAKKGLKISPQFLKRVGDCYTQVKLTTSCGVHTDPGENGHFEFFERSTFVGESAVVAHGKMTL